MMFLTEGGDLAAFFLFSFLFIFHLQEDRDFLGGNPIFILSGLAGSPPREYIVHTAASSHLSWVWVW